VTCILEELRDQGDAERQWRHAALAPCYSAPMDGALALVFGLVAVGLITLTPLPWLKAGGGFLLVLTLIFILTDGIRLLFG
jgi:hypothetical protein